MRRTDTFCYSLIVISAGEWAACLLDIVSLKFVYCIQSHIFLCFYVHSSSKYNCIWPCVGVSSAVCVCVCAWIMGPESSSSSHCSGPNPALPGSQLTLWLVMAVLRLFHRKKWATMRRVKSRRGGEKAQERRERERERERKNEGKRDGG